MPRAGTFRHRLALTCTARMTGLEPATSGSTVPNAADENATKPGTLSSVGTPGAVPGAVVGKAKGLIRLLLPALAVQRAVQALEEEKAAGELPQRLRLFSIEGTLLVGPVQLDALSLHSLASGDVILLEGVRREGERLTGPAWLATRSFRLFGQLGPEGLCVHRASTCANPPELSVSSSPEEVTASIPSLPIELAVELVRLHLQLSELAMMKPGADIPMNINSAEPVVLRVGDRAIARAELVEIEGAVGARILALLP